MNGWTRRALCAVAVALFAIPVAAQAQEQDQVLLVPYSQKNPELPHPAHENAQITLKGIIRNATCGEYDVTWDVNRDGVYNDWTRRVSRNGTTLNVQDIGRTFRVPAVPRDQSYNLNVRVRNRCNNVEKFGTFRMFVYDFSPSSDPRQWTDEQIEIMASMAVQESLWYTHRQMSDISGRDVSTIRGR